MGGNIKKIEATSEDILNLAQMHLKDKLPLKRMADKMGMSLMWCTKTLQEVGLYVGADGSDEERDRKWNHGNPLITRPEPFFKEGVEYVAVCKATGKEFDDFRNVSGALTAHLRGLKVPMADQSDFKKKKFQTEQGRPWFVDHFEFIQPKPKETRTYQYQSRAEITEMQFTAIKKGYLEDGLSMRALEVAVGMSSSLIHRVLLEWDMFVPFPPLKDWPNKHERLGEHKRLRSEKVKQNIRFDKKGAPSFFEEGKNYVAVCKQTGEQFNDYLNTSGIITRHLEKIMPDMEHETNTKKREFFKTTGRPWYHEHFEFNEVEIVAQEKRRCAYCDWTTNDLTNASGWYTAHLRDVHGFSAIEHTSNHPEENDLFSTAISNEKRENRHDESIYGDDFINCMECDEKLKYVTNSHLKKHGMTSWEYKLKYPLSMSCSTNFKKRMTTQLASVQELAIPKWVSGPEADLRGFISSIGLEFNGSNRSLLKGTEVDIVIPSINIGIEFNGNRYHSEVYGKKGRMHHLDKLIKMNDVGYGLIQIFEDEWGERGEQVRSKLKRMLGQDESSKVNARDCEVSLIDPSLKNAFLNRFHIQGEDRSTIHYGLMYNDDLVAVMTFDPHRNMTQSKEGQYELKRFATKDGLFVRGGAGKLLSAFIREVKPKSIMSFADRRWTLNANNNMYTKLGFQFDGATPPEYHYYNNKLHRIKRWSKFGFGRSSIASKFPHIYDPLKTEWQMMQEAGFDRIWDCGKFRYVMNLQPSQQ